MTVLSGVGSADLSCLSKAPYYIILIFNTHYFTRLSGKLSAVCGFSLYFLPFTKTFFSVWVKPGEESKLPQALHGPVCSRLCRWPKTISHRNLHIQLVRLDAVSVHFLSFWADQSLCYHEEERPYIKQKLHQLTVPYLHTMWSLYFLIPSTGFLRAEVSADVTTVVFKCMITPVPYLVSSCLPLMTSGLFTWGLGNEIKALWLQKSEDTYWTGLTDMENFWSTRDFDIICSLLIQNR